MKRMPVVFVGHGSPLNTIEENRFVNGWRKMAEQIEKPRAILCISAHWYTTKDAVSYTENPETIYDFYGFPEELYQISYPAKGSKELAQQVYQLLGGKAELDDTRGLDHGAWSVLRILYPKADIPVCQLSVNAHNTVERCFEMGEKLKVLRENGILVLASGNIVHNLSMVDWRMENKGFDWAERFDTYIKEAVCKKEYGKVMQYLAAGSDAKFAFPTRDHFDPLLYALGMLHDNDTVQIYNNECVLGSLSMTSYLWKEQQL